MALCQSQQKICIYCCVYFTQSITKDVILHDELLFVAAENQACLCFPHIFFPYQQDFEPESKTRTNEKHDLSPTNL